MSAPPARAAAPNAAERDGRGGVSEPPHARRALRPGYAAAAVALVAAAAVVATWLLVRDGQGGPAPGEAAVPTGTAQVERRDLVETESLEGTLGYAGLRTVAYAGAGTAAGAPARLGGEDAGQGAAGGATVTWLPGEGAVIGRGEPLFRVDDEAMLLLTGETPAWRTMRQGTEGPDVRQLERNLVAMGYGTATITVDERFGAATKRAVQRWQRDLGVPRTGIVELGRVAFLPGKRRVESLDVALGDRVQAGQTVLTTTSTRRIVTVELDAHDQGLLAAGDAVTVELPDGSELAGTVDEVGSVASAGESDADGQAVPGEQGEGTSATVSATIALDEPGRASFDEAPVDVEVATDSAEDVLAVPVTALVALLGGGYAVEVVDEAGGTRLVRVEPGIYAEGYVEVEGEGIEPGTTVVVPA